MSEQHTEPRPPSFGERARGWARKAVLALILIAAAVGGYFLAESFLPRWWAQQIGHRVDGSFSGGFGIGLANVRDRLAARFGDAATIVSGPSLTGYETELRMPMVKHV